MYLLHTTTHSGCFLNFAMINKGALYIYLCINTFYPHQIISKKHYPGSKGVYTFILSNLQKRCNTTNFPQQYLSPISKSSQYQMVRILLIPANVLSKKWYLMAWLCISLITTSEAGLSSSVQLLHICMSYSTFYDIFSYLFVYLTLFHMSCKYLFF